MEVEGEEVEVEFEVEVEAEAAAAGWHRATLGSSASQQRRDMGSPSSGRSESSPRATPVPRDRREAASTRASSRATASFPKTGIGLVGGGGGSWL